MAVAEINQGESAVVKITFDDAVASFDKLQFVFANSKGQKLITFETPTITGKRAVVTDVLTPLLATLNVQGSDTEAWAGPVYLEVITTDTRAGFTNGYRTLLREQVFNVKETATKGKA